MARMFDHFAGPDAGRIAAFSSGHLYAVGDELFRQGDPPELVFFLERGLVKLVRAHADGGEERIVGLRAQGWILGAAAVIANEPYVATAVSVTPSFLARLSAGAFRDLLETDRVISRRVHEMHAREVYAGLTQLAEEGIPARKRLEHFLAYVTPSNSPLTDRFPLKQWEIAQLVGVTPQHLCQLMAKRRVDRALRNRAGSSRAGQDQRSPHK